MKKLAGIVFAIALCVMVQAPQAQAATTTTNVSSLLETLKSLMAQVEVLRAELAKIKGEVRETLKDGLREGMSDADIKKIQEILASDQTIYPEGKITGYYGPLTKEAVKRFQKKNGLAPTGEVSGDTKKLLEEYLKARFGETYPEGLLRAPGIAKKVQKNLCEQEKVGAWGLFCKDHKKDKDKDEDEDEDEDEDDEDEDEDDEDEDEDEDDEYEVEVEIENGKTTVSFNYDNDDYTVTVSSTSQSAVLEEVADELDMDLDDVEDALVDDIKEELGDALDEDEDANEEDDAEDAISDAEDEIDAVQEDIDDANNDVDVDDAQDKLDDAKELLEDAEDAFDDEDWSEAEDLADEAEDKAKDAADELEDAEDAA